ncbi:MAG: FAD-dependent oxidoreductase [Candidatus Dojkabacteria bacterium]|nr:FAD-dependent oxidoreductase [Candidatus Dojkabacteria bacterium]
MSESNIYDIAIIGSGPAGLSSSIYASRYRLSNIVFGKIIGGTISEAHKVCNYPGIPDISGIDLAYKIYEQAKTEGATLITEGIKEIIKENDTLKLITDSGKEYQSKTVILATGTERNKLHIPNEDKYIGKGLSYCSTCDAMFYKDKIVGIVGGSSAATMSATMLSEIAKEVYIIYRGEALRGEPAWIEQATSKNNVHVILQTVITELQGEDRLERIKLSKPYNNSEYLSLNGLFIEIGSEPNKDLPSKLGLNLDGKGYIIVDGKQRTSIEGIWAAGDCTNNSNSFKQVITACSEGAVASNDIFEYLKTAS